SRSLSRTRCSMRTQSPVSNDGSSLRSPHPASSGEATRTPASIAWVGHGDRRLTSRVSESIVDLPPSCSLRRAQTLWRTPARGPWTQLQVRDHTPPRRVGPYGVVHTVV